MLSCRLLAVSLAIALCAHPLSADVLAGRVLEDHTGAPLTRTEVRVSQPDVPGIVAEIETDPQGRFRATGLPAGEYRLQFSKANYAGATLRLRTRPLEPGTDALTLRLVRYGAISGHVFDADSRPVHAAQVIAVHEPADGPAVEPAANQTVTYNNGGAFRVYGLPPGRYRLAVLSTGEGQDIRRGALWNPNNTQPREFVVAGGEEYTGADFLVPAAIGYSVSGKLNLPQPGRPLGITLVAAGHPGLRVAMGISRPDGSFRFDNILDGAYDLLASSPATAASAPGFGRARIVVASRPVEDVSVPVNQGRTVTLRLTGDCGADAVATLSPMESWLSGLKISAPLHPPHPVTLDHVAPGRFVLSVKSPGGHCYGGAKGVLDFTSDAAPAPVEVALGPSGSIHGRLTGVARPADFAIVLIPLHATDASPMQMAALRLTIFRRARTRSRLTRPRRQPAAGCRSLGAPPT
jgi:hypothetical protein